MYSDYEPPTIPATADYVLGVIVDLHRQQVPWDPEADPDAVLTFDTTVAEWRDACDLVKWRRLGRALNTWWSIHCPDAEWRAALNPPRVRTLRNVCQLIAANARRPVIRPVTMLGKPCATAGAFLTIRWILRKAGADAENIGPSTALAPFCQNYSTIFFGPISRLAPGKLPQSKIRNPFHTWLIFAGFTLSWLSLVLGWLLGPGVVAVAIVSIGIFYCLVLVTARGKHKSVEFGSLVTFRDLACLLAEGVE